jgi:hypothetical protein
LNRELKTFSACSLQDAVITKRPQQKRLIGDWHGGENDKDHD